jgi:hypothetical protein
MLVKIQDVWLNPSHVVSVQDSEIVGVTRILVTDGSGRAREYLTDLRPETVVRKLNRPMRAVRS